MDQNGSRDSYTILRIKRKRTEEPLEALVVDGAKRRKSKGGVLDAFGHGVFQFAETVEKDVWDDENRANAMRDRLTSIARKVVPLKKSAIPNPAGSPEKQRSHLGTDETSRRYAIIPKSTPSESSVRGGRKRRFDHEPEDNRSPPSPRPPVVRSSRELREEKQRALAEQFRMYDAISMASPTAQAIPFEDDPEMADFVPMLQEYLRVHDISVHSSPQVPATCPTVPMEIVNSDSQSSDDDYVWDVFIHRTVSLDEWNSLAILGSVTGLPEDDDYPSDESEVEDEADEDSNEENWYGNDYPDEETDSEDDVFDDDSPHQWRN